MYYIIIICIAIVVVLIFRNKYESKLNYTKNDLRREMQEKELKTAEYYRQAMSDAQKQHNDASQAAIQAYNNEITKLKIEHEKSYKEHRTDAVKRSKQVVSGQVYEQISPLVPGFPYELRDARHVGSPLDFIIFRGLSGSGDIEIVFLEIKTGASTLNSNERRVKRAVEDGRVRYDVFHPDLDHNIEEALEASITPIRPEITADGLFIEPGEIVVPTDTAKRLYDQLNNEPTETLTCTHCKKVWERPISAGRKPLFCPKCRGTG